MKKKMKKRTGKWMCAIALTLIMIVANMEGLLVAKAAGDTVPTSQGSVDLSQGDASITIKGNEGQSLVGKTFEIYQLFEAENAAGLESIEYTMNSTYVNALKTVVGSKLGKEAKDVAEYEVLDYMQTMNSHTVEGAQTGQTVEGSYSDYRYFMEEVIKQIQTEGISGEFAVKVVDTKSDNSIEIKGLAYGYYLVEDTSAASGEHTAVSMLMTSTANPEFKVNIKADYPTVTKKIQEDDNQDTIGNDGWNDIADFEIGQDVPYKYESTIPNINGYDTYYFAWHDIMDEALTLQSDTIQITLSGTASGAEKTYSLLETEYKLITDSEDTTFTIEIEDIKAIIDREFDNLNEDNENIYGQKVVVTYKATLNDKAALDTGRPGFENDVRIEFSNNPNQDGKGQTGYTPWDTVVCFTYQLNGLKVNNYGKKLEGATFRLYTDEACENEVYVKKVADRYHVMNPDSWESGVPGEAVEMVSNEDGEFDIYGLDSGTYYLKEVSAPAGYRPILDPVKISITPTFTTERNSYVKGDGASDSIMQLTASAHLKTFTNGAYTEKDVTLEVDQEKGSMNLSVVNEVGNKLPITGSGAMLILSVAGIALMAIALKKGRKQYE